MMTIIVYNIKNHVHVSNKTMIQTNTHKTLKQVYNLKNNCKITRVERKS